MRLQAALDPLMTLVDLQAETISPEDSDVLESMSLNPALAKVWLLTQVSDAVKLCTEMAAGEALAAGLPLADIGRAAGKSTSNVRRDFPLIEQFSSAAQASRQTGEPIRGRTRYWGWSVGADGSIRVHALTSDGLRGSDDFVLWPEGYRENGEPETE